MLLLSNRLVDVPIMSLQTGSELARTVSPIIDPRNLCIVAFYVDGPLIDTKPAILHVSDIREVGEIGIIIDNSDKLMGLDGLVRLQALIDLNFELVSTSVYQRDGSKLGRVSDFSFDPSNHSIEQLYIKQSFLRSLSSTSNIINRRQVISITKDRIVVDSPTIPQAIAKKASQASSLVNPFRSSPQPDQIDSET